MARFKQLFTLQLLMLAFTFNAFSQAGTLDDTFGTDGKLLFDIGDAWDVAHSIVSLEDTTTVLCGAFSDDGVPTAFVTRLFENGDQDLTFGNNGYTEFQIGLETYARSMVLLSDGSLLVAGMTYITYSDEDIFVARISQDGTIDPTFGTSGYILYNYDDSMDECNTMAVQPDGKIVLAGSTQETTGFKNLLFMRINPDGSLDSGFGTNGYTVINASVQGESVRGIDFMSNGDIVGTGYGYVGDPLWTEQVFVSKLDNNGNPISSFGGDGVLTPAVFPGKSEGWDVKIMNDSIVVTGFVDPGGYVRDLFLTKLNENGVADPAFATNGVSIIDLNVWDIGIDILIQGDNKILVSGSSGVGGSGDSEFFLLRYLANGTLDYTFNSVGYVLTNFRQDWDEPYGIAMQPDGKLVMAGVDGGFTTSGENKIPVARYLNDYTPFGAAFTVTPNPVCAGSTVDFTDLSTGDIDSWSWTFEGGTPSTSTDQNPSVVYSTPGDYDVQLVITDPDGITSTILSENYIKVIETPAQAGMPDGEASVCSSSSYNYTTTEVLYATNYDWELSPTTAGEIIENGVEATIEFTDGWSGDFTLKVRATNSCGTGDWSDVLEGTANLTPAEFTLLGGGTACEGSEGVEITLDGSEADIVYELFLDDAPTGITVEGTGSPISFGYIDVEGYYTSQAFNGNCIAYMTEQVFVEITPLPSQAGTPEGPVSVCSEPTSEYSSNGADDADSYVWTLLPEFAGSIDENGLQATVTWSTEFSGTATITIAGANDCGEGTPSEELEIAVGAANPVISGEEMVCDFSDETYSVVDNSGSTFLWTITGGTIIDGQGTYMITVAWEGEGNGTLSIEEETVDGCTGSSDEFFVTIDDCTGIGENDRENTLTIYPNPATDFISISSQEKLTGIKILNADAKTILSQEVNDFNIKLNIKNMDKGIYFIQMQSEQKIIVKKLIVK
jgi:uncharacterized delta-60 repeat protein